MTTFQLIVTLIMEHTTWFIEYNRLGIDLGFILIKEESA